ncbi:hypothetical protein CEP54_010505 [Fusarium duplospermum]|uniref:Xylanolytic transcriptional activator regulatory domain-containing protein n=1 Tax=Fusarium duplospermum TaxID=1325734 RepID=A0A428PJL5_9HYPO|nr:hypothetical protein CEP54_010505 [Fusarium duplospermum]
MSETLYSLAKQTTSSTLNTPSMNTLIAMTLLAVYEIGQPYAALNALTTLSSALALMGAFQLDRMDQPDFSFTCLWLSKPKNWVVEEGRRRVAWMIICLARWAAALTGQNFGISTRLDIQMLLPVSNKAWNAADNARPHTGLIHESDDHNELGPFARFVKVQHFFGLVHEQKQSLHIQDQSADGYGERTAELYSQIQRFIQSFPPDWGKGLSVHDERMLDPTTLCMAHCACLLLDGLHEISLSKEYQHSSCERSTLHAEELLDMAHTIQDQSHLGNFMLPHCWLLAARFHLLIKCLLTFGTCWGLQDRMLNHVASIQSSTMMFGTPLTTFDPETPDKPPLPPRQPTPVFMPGEDANMLSSSGNVQDQLADHTGLLRGLDENFAMDDLVVPDCHALDDSVFGSIIQWSIASWGPDKDIELMDL